jgi:hypothetical protein
MDVSRALLLNLTVDEGRQLTTWLDYLDASENVPPVVRQLSAVLDEWVARQDQLASPAPGDTTSA